MEGGIPAVREAKVRKSWIGLTDFLLSQKASVVLPILLLLAVAALVDVLLYVCVGMARKQGGLFTTFVPLLGSGLEFILQLCVMLRILNWQLGRKANWLQVTRSTLSLVGPSIVIFLAMVVLYMIPASIIFAILAATVIPRADWQTFLPIGISALLAVILWTNAYSIPIMIVDRIGGFRAVAASLKRSLSNPIQTLVAISPNLAVLVMACLIWNLNYLAVRIVKDLMQVLTLMFSLAFCLLIHIEDGEIIPEPPNKSLELTP
jgi:hypothetical protein